MALDEGDLEKVPANLTARDCYDRIWSWHKSHGEAAARARGLDGDGLAKYLSILDELPTEQDASPEDMAFLFREVVTASFEWSYHEEDSHGIKMAAYAYHAIDRDYGGDISNLDATASASLLQRLKG